MGGEFEEPLAHVNRFKNSPENQNPNRRTRRQLSTHKPLQYLTLRRVRQVRRVDLQFLPLGGMPPFMPDLAAYLPMNFQGVL